MKFKQDELRYGYKEWPSANMIALRVRILSQQVKLMKDWVRRILTYQTVHQALDIIHVKHCYGINEQTIYMSRRP